MRKMILPNGRTIGDDTQPYIIAEMNSSHNGKMDVAKEMINEAKECGCDCVKFQSWSAESLYSEEYYAQNPISQRIVGRLSLDEKQLLELCYYCKDIEIDFSSTPYSESEVDFLAEKAKVPFIKISSMEINNLSFIRYIAQKKLPIVLSTGMSTIDEIHEAVKSIESTGNNNICILHCVSQYPAEAKIINLNNIKMLKDEFSKYPIGYSDHTIGCEVAAASVALGASVVEKHFTLDNTKMGMDNNMATEPEDMKKLVEVCHNVYCSMGDYDRKLSDGESEQRKKMRRSIVAKHDLSEGLILDYSDLEMKRPGDGLEPNLVDSLIGKRLKNSVNKGYKLKKEDIE